MLVVKIAIYENSSKNKLTVNRLWLSARSLLLFRGIYVHSLWQLQQNFPVNRERNTLFATHMVNKCSYIALHNKRVYTNLRQEAISAQLTRSPRRPRRY